MPCHPCCWCSPEAEERDPACYKFTDAFLLESITDFESREQLWEVLGRDNLAAVRSVITAAARLDRRYCGQLHAVALLGRARQLSREGQGGQLAELLRDGDSLALVRDLEGRSLWHDLAVAQGGRGGPLLRLLLPIAATAAAAGAGQGPQLGTRQRRRVEWMGSSSWKRGSTKKASRSLTVSTCQMRQATRRCTWPL